MDVFSFRFYDGVKQVSTDGGSTWENFSSGLVSITDSFVLTNPLLNNIGMNSNIGYVIYTLYPIDFTDINSITHQFQHLSVGSTALFVSITDNKLTNSSDIVNNASFNISCVSGSSWVYSTETVFDTSNITGKKYIGITLANAKSSAFVNLIVFKLNKSGS